MKLILVIALAVVGTAAFLSKVLRPKGRDQ